MRVVLDHPADLDGWRRAARALVMHAVPPEEASWAVAGEGDDLLTLGSGPPPPVGRSQHLTVPRRFLELARDAVCHSDSERFGLLYRLLWRLQHEPYLFGVTTDRDVYRAGRLAEAVRRDIHKMTAYVRFREIDTADGPAFLSWFEPDHHIVDAAAPFFVDRFANMRWSILTPRRSAHWDGGTLRFERGAARDAVPDADRLEEHWRAYFSSIFNPARLNPAAMTREMPKKYWRNLPETRVVPELTRGAAERVRAMIEESAPMPGPVDDEAVTDNRVAAASCETLSALAAAAARCRACPLWRDATQTVFGEGPSDAPLMLVGEQPGDQEDTAGRPFVGPAGKVLDRALAQAGIDRDRVYVTNAVKHFKFERRGKRRIHSKPDAGEIEHCRWWLERERELIRPRIVVALGATAARALAGRPLAIGRSRGRPMPLDAGTMLVTVHPSYLLRLRDERQKVDEYGRFVADLEAARGLL